MCALIMEQKYETMIDDEKNEWQNELFEFELKMQIFHFFLKCLWFEQLSNNKNILMVSYWFKLNFLETTFPLL